MHKSLLVYLWKRKKIALNAPIVKRSIKNTLFHSSTAWIGTTILSKYVFLCNKIEIYFACKLRLIKIQGLETIILLWVFPARQKYLLTQD